VTAPTLCVRVTDGVYAGVAPIEAAKAAGRLTGDDLARLRDLPAWKVRQYLASRSLLRALLAEVVDADAAARPLSARAGGQPWLRGRSEIGVALSHSGGAVAAAVGLGRAVGVDVERVQAVSDGLVRRCCTPGGRRLLARLAPEQRAEAFSWIWAAQEACVKATGAGMAGRPWTVPVEPHEQAGSWGTVRWRRLGTGRAPAAVCAYATGIRGGADG
jgi:4'-phosphopantetheinyl transferase